MTRVPDQRPHELEYAHARANSPRRRIIRWLLVLIAVKFVLVVLNIAMAFSGAPDLLRLLGVGAQIALTGIFLVMILKLANR